MLYQGLSGFQIKHHIELYIHQILSNKKGLYQVFDYKYFQQNPLMIRVDTDAGHGAGKPTSKSIEEYTDLFCFLIKAIGIQYRN